MTNINKQWQESPARLLTPASYLPKSPDQPSRESAAKVEQVRQTAALAIIRSSGEALGRDSAERRLYLDTAGEKYGQVLLLAEAEELRTLFAMLRESGSSLDVQDESVKESVKKDIAHINFLSEKLFGNVTAERMSIIVSQTQLRARSILADEASDEESKAAARNILAQFPEIEGPIEYKNFAPSSELLADWKEPYEEKYADLSELVDPSRAEYTSDELKVLFEAGIKVFATKWNLPGTEAWQVKLGNDNISVDIETNTVWIPADKTYNIDRIIPLLNHEIGGHLLRILNGERTGDAFMGSDMPGRAMDEEALLACLEQVFSGEPRESGLVYYTAIGLASGIVGGERVPLDKLEPLVLDYVTVTNGKKLTEKELSMAKVRIHRVTRGMPSVYIDGELHQATYNADLKYALGQEHAVDFLEKNRHRAREALEEVMLGRFAYSNPDQMAYALAKSAPFLKKN
jgi:hypothetical protein